MVRTSEVSGPGRKNQMKTLLSRFGKVLAVTAGAALVMAAATPVPKSTLPAAAEVGASETAPATASETGPETVPAVLAVKPSVGTLPANFKPSPALDEVIRLAQAGVGDELLLAYIANANRDFSPSAEEIIFLHDLGVSEAVITLLIKSKPGSAQAAAATAQPAPASNATAVTVVAAQPTAAPAAEVAPVVVSEPPQQVTVNYFYESLAPYGSWVEVADHGWCWQPTVVVVNAGWSPYSDRGRWLWTSSGWYWQSDYSWGWAPFHYGRWYRHPRHSWVWVPDTTWGPSWVSWRSSAGYCGWAPLPPAAHFQTGIGFTWHSGSVGIGFEFGLGWNHYTYVPASRFCDRNPYAYRIGHDHVQVVHNQTTVINNYVTGNNNTIINHGPGRDAIARSVPRPIPTVVIRDETHRGGSKHQPDRIVQEGNQQVIHRAVLPQKAPTASQLTRSESERRSATPTTGRPVEQIVASLNQPVPATVAERNVHRLPTADAKRDLHRANVPAITTGNAPAVPANPATTPRTTSFKPGKPSVIEQSTAQPSAPAAPGESRTSREARTRSQIITPQNTPMQPSAAPVREQNRGNPVAPSRPDRTISVQPPAPVIQQPRVQPPVGQPPSIQQPVIQPRRTETPREVEHRTPRGNPPAQPSYQAPAPQYQSPAPAQRSYSPPPAPTPRVESPAPQPSPSPSRGNSGSPRNEPPSRGSDRPDRPGRP